jgi:uncharacterized membrane protein HdeD (DUF308 family)
MEEVIQVFRAGKESFIGWHWEDGKSVGRILNQGAGVFLEERFVALADATAFCEGELAKDPSTVFYLLRGDDIIEAVLDEAYHAAEEKRKGRWYAVVSGAVVMILALIVSVMAMPFQEITGHVLFVAGMTLLYALFLVIMGTRNIEGAVLMPIVLVLAVLLANQLSEDTQAEQGAGPGADLKHGSSVADP